MNLLKRAFSVLLLALPIGFSGCAYYKITPIPASETAGWTRGTPPDRAGYIIYQPELYFSATITTETTTDEAGKPKVKENVTVTPLYLPNYQKPYRVTTHNFLAKADFSFEFENGWKLTKLADKSDNSTVANTLAGQLSAMLSAAGLPAADKGAGTKRRVILYRPEFDRRTGYFISFKQVESVEDPGPGAPGQKPKGVPGPSKRRPKR